MANWKDHIIKTGATIEDKWDEWRSRFKIKFGLNDPIQIVPFRSYGTAGRIYVKGRVLEDKKIASAGDKDNILHNLLNMYKRFESDEVPNATIQLSIGSETHTTITNKEGYFVFNLQPVVPIVTEKLWHPIRLQIIDAPIPFSSDIKTEAEIMIPPVDAEYGIISDLDDTVIETHATSLLAMSRTTFLNNAKTRLPFAGVAEFYKALQLGRNGKRNNPFFYVSSSPWNLYDLLQDFLDFNSIPAGPLLLRDLGLDKGSVTANSDHQSHKLQEIKQILDAYPHLPFILIGDTGQEDPAIYQQVVTQYPNRILAIYIRDVQLPERKAIAIEISQSLQEHKTEMLVVANTVEAASHAANNGFIFTEAIPAIEQDKQQDKGEAPGKEAATITS